MTILNAGNLRLHLAEEMAVPEEVWRPNYADLFEPVGVCPSLSVYIEHAGARTLVDIGDYRATVTPELGVCAARLYTAACHHRPACQPWRDAGRHQPGGHHARALGPLRRA